MEFQIKTEQFEGPIRVLLDLIESRKLHVSEVSLAVVAEDFLNYMNSRELSHTEISSFIVIASTLVLIKARSLLPSMELTDEETQSIDDLTERIRQYQIVQKYAQMIAPRYLERVSFERNWVDRNPIFAPDAAMIPGTLEKIMEQLFIAFPVMEKIPEKAIRTVVSIEEAIEKLTQRIQTGITFHFRDLSERYKNAGSPEEKKEAKVFAVVSFLAMLELVKKGIAKVLQQENFADIELANATEEAS